MGERAGGGRRGGTAIELRGASFRYPEEGRASLARVDLVVRRGSVVGVVGRAGAGKSILAALIAGEREPTTGSVTRGNRRIAAFDVLRRPTRIAVVRDGAPVFGASIRANIAAAVPGASVEDVARAARAAELHEEIVCLPDGYDTKLDAGGASLNPAQRQRLAIARAVLSRAPILVLDEAIGALDARTRRQILANLVRLGLTTVVLTRSAATVATADRIAVLDEGCLVEEGRHFDLMASSALYRELGGVAKSLLAPRVSDTAQWTPL